MLIALFPRPVLIGAGLTIGEGECKMRRGDSERVEAFRGEEKGEPQE